ncbi:cytochrome P450 [Streptomyces sp. NPDC015220]|uniref:cytochrome P450 n=1 Tax=Streptomyces sp. NPDC015220 TaxID=3364947 RepID=UPI0036F84230
MRSHDRGRAETATARSRRLAGDRGGRSAVLRGACIPFGAGGHQCIGELFARAEMMATVVAVVNQWRLLPVLARQGRGVMTSTRHPRGLVMAAWPRTRVARPQG